MAGFLATATEREGESGVALKELARESIAGKTLAVCERADGTLVLARERAQGKRGDDGKRSRDNGTEYTVKPTSALADIAHAIEAGLL